MIDSAASVRLCGEREIPAQAKESIRPAAPPARTTPSELVSGSRKYKGEVVTGGKRDCQFRLRCQSRGSLANTSSSDRATSARTMAQAFTEFASTGVTPQ